MYRVSLGVRCRSSPLRPNTGCLDNNMVSLPLDVLIAEDDPSLVSILVEDLKEFPEISVKTVVGTGTDAIKLINHYDYDALFLDIKLPGISGVDLYKLIKKKKRHVPYVVFITAYKDEAFAAFHTRAVAFLLKSYPFRKLRSIIEKILKNYHLFQHTGHNEISLKARLACKAGREIQMVSFKDIKYLQSDAHKTFVHTLGGEIILIKDLLKYVQPKLPKDLFLRVHKRYIVHLNRVASVTSFRGGRCTLYLDDETKTSIAVGRSYLEPFKKRLRV